MASFAWSKYFLYGEMVRVRYINGIDLCSFYIYSYFLPLL